MHGLPVPADGVMSQSFSRDLRLRSRSQFTAVQEHGRRVAMRHLILIGAPNDVGHDRLGIIASRRLGGAVLRNRAKRRLRELFRTRDAASATLHHLDLVAIPRRELVTAPIVAVASDFSRALGRLRVASTS